MLKDRPGRHDTRLRVVTTRVSPDDGLEARPPIAADAASAPTQA